MTLALAMFSGGLDSMLAARLVMEQGIDVLALQFITPFFGFKAKGREDDAAREFYARYGINVRIIDVTADYLKMIRNPRYGYGKNFNPCLDCKIFLMGRAKVVIQETGAAFILSGEVLGQRPMSQRRDAMRIVERDSGLDGYLLRPLCAKLLKPTIAEEKGIVDRSRLMDISGRGRTRQMELAARFGITEYPTPAGGCMLTDPILSKRIEKLLAGNEEVAVEDVRLCAAGRHFRLPCGMLYVGRNDLDNDRLESLAYLYQQDPINMDLLLGDHGPLQTEIANPESKMILNRYSIQWSISAVPDPRPDLRLDCRRVNLTITPALPGGDANSNPRMNKILKVSTILARSVQ